MGIGIMHMDQENWDKSLEYLETASRDFEVVGNEGKMGEALLNISNVYLRQKNYVKALEKCQDIMNRINTRSNKLQSSRLLLTISKIHAAMGDITLSLDHAHQAHLLALDYGDNDAQLESLLHLADLFKGVDPDSSAFYMQLHQKLKEQTFTPEQLSSISQIQASYEASRLEEEKEWARRKQSSKPPLYLASALLVLIAYLLAITLYKLYRNR